MRSPVIIQEVGKSLTPLSTGSCKIFIFNRGLFPCHMKFERNLSISKIALLFILRGSICIGYNILGSTFILIILILPIHDRGRSNHRLRSCLTAVKTGEKFNLYNSLTFADTLMQQTKPVIYHLNGKLTRAARSPKSPSGRASDLS